MGVLSVLASRLRRTTTLRRYSKLYQYPDRPMQRTALILLLGVEQAEVDRFVGEGHERLGRKFDRMVFVVTASDFREFRARGLVVEHFPARRPPGTERDWARYLGRRYEIVIAKWSPDWVLSYGLDLATYLTAFGAPAPEQPK